MSDEEMNWEQILDGLALWQETKPQTVQDWIEIAERYLDSHSDYSGASPEFKELVTFVFERREAEEQSRLAAEALLLKTRKIREGGAE